VYKGHPYSKDVLGTEKSVKSITRDDLVDCYQRFITPKGTRIAVVGDLSGYDTLAVVSEQLGKWQGEAIEEIKFPSLGQLSKQEICYPINRDQIVLCMAGLSINRTNQDFDKLLLFDQIFGSGALGSMASRLFMLREETGLFYTINGSVVTQATEQPGMVVIKAIASIDRLKEAQERINQLVDAVTKSITPHELEEAKRAVLNALVNNFESNNGIAQSFLLLDRYGFGPDYFDKRASMLEPITLLAMQDAVKKVLGTDKLATLVIGRTA
jgi:zinc protease